ncbi:hypothetical protein Pyrfu_0134 [Pyrolobus fumarii 1A]|uniref:Uncharacterized protein n=1 Tax=Pyrolobus fumarii (strain DSM 11204 / 1A) TaxID=694429 RepID=G0EEG5_PYRF1|nr:hypothetical protein [Pyrolobus fumarii]AEM38006.1 hypothetical protein Pyrfu_0134 [Pyrolobus fumarii 1A]
MPVDLWKEVFLSDRPEPAHLELFVKLLVSDPRLALEEAARRVRYEAKPDTVVAWRDPVPLLAIASIHYVEGTKPKVILVQEAGRLVELTLEALTNVLEFSVMPVTYPTGYGKQRVKDALEKILRIVRGASINIVDVTDAPAPIGIALHRAGVRNYTITRRKGFEVLIEKFNL